MSLPTTASVDSKADQCRLLFDPPAAGAWNMALDEALLESATAGNHCTLRFYQWSEPTLSLGYFQKHEDRAKHIASNGCALVRRSSGGGAILHDRELTYSFTVPPEHRLARTPTDLYHAFHGSLLETLGLLAGSNFELSAGNARVPAADEPFLCFRRHAPGDVLLNGHKIAGSAQRRHRGAVLQHGSILLKRSALAAELPGVQELTGVRIEPEILARKWSAMLATHLSLRLEPSEADAALLTFAQRLADTKYGLAAWACLK
jgi:lipoate-protein ligase A